ncbi:MAG: hypothetical protein K5739_10555, partial [Lachnospiraceae bacterium]|nr:hypothetical protein [Lachnospiraceae bacterium]
MPLTFIGIFEKIVKRTGEKTFSLVSSLLLFEGLVLLLANLLSIGSVLSPLTATFAWLLAAVILLSPSPQVTRENGFLKSFWDHRRRMAKEFFASASGKCKATLKELSLPEKILLAGCAVVVVALFIPATFNVPYNYDSMTYHLARIAHWMDNGSVNYYLTNIDRQLYSPVLAEYNLLFMRLLSGTDMVLNLQQYAAMIFSAYLIFGILRKLGTGRLFSLFGVFVYLTMPLTISQAITTQNDLCAGLFYLVFLYYLLLFMEKDPAHRIASMPVLSICLGASVGFAYLTKPSVCASMVFFMPWVLIVCIRRKDSVLDLLKWGGAAFGTLLVLLSETLIRTYISTGHLIADTTGGDIAVATKNIRYLIVNLMKNYCLLITQHFITGLNGFMYRLAISVGRILQVDFNNIAISFHGFDFITYLNTGLDMYSQDRTSSAFAAYLSLAGGFLLLIALVAALIRVLVSGKVAGRDRKSVVSFGFVISAWMGFGFIMTLLRWQPWGSRLMYPGLTVATVASVHILGCF